jgi:hypothetical protein
MVLLSWGISSSGCSQSPSDASMAELQATADGLALEWESRAVLVAAWTVERDASIPPPDALDAEQGPAELGADADDNVGDGLARWWVFGYQARSTPAKVWVAVRSDGETRGPMDWAGDLDADDAPTAQAPLGIDVIDSTAAWAALKAYDVAWAQDAPAASAGVQRIDKDAPATWIVTLGHGLDTTDLLTGAVDAATGEVLCSALGDGSVTFAGREGRSGGTLLATDTRSEEFELEDGQDGLHIQLAADSVDPLASLRATFTGPDGKSAELSWSSGDPAVEMDLTDAAPGSWMSTIALTGLTATYELSWETLGKKVTCEPFEA